VVINKLFIMHVMQFRNLFKRSWGNFKRNLLNLFEWHVQFSWLFNVLIMLIRLLLFWRCANCVQCRNVQ